MSIWKYHKYLKPKIRNKYQLSLNEGGTPCTICQDLSKELKIEKIFIKREDLNPTGSFKDRSLAYQMSYYYQKGVKEFIISSSGNAAISAANYSKLFQNSTHIFISKNIPLEKLKRLLRICNIDEFNRSILLSDKKETITKDKFNLYFSRKPKSDSIKFKNKNKETIYLRGSTDDTAITGFKTLSYELYDQAHDADSIFIPCSSGTSSIGIFQGYSDLKLKSPSIHIVQTSKIHPIAVAFDKDFKKSQKSVASAISDRVSHRKEQVEEIVKKTKGSGWVINDTEIQIAQDMFKSLCSINVSSDAALSLAALQKALKSRYNIQRPILILSGE